LKSIFSLAQSEEEREENVDKGKKKLLVLLLGQKRIHFNTLRAFRFLS
jgi:hypothetical protein